MRAFLLIAIIISSSILSCGIFGPEDNVRAYEIVEVRNMPIQTWVDSFQVEEIEGFDWPEKIELDNYKEGKEIKGRVKMHYIGWLPIDDISIDGFLHFRVIINYEDVQHEEIYLLRSVLFLWDTIETEEINGTIMYDGPLIDESLGLSYRASKQS